MLINHMNNNLKIAGGDTTQFNNPVLGDTLKNLLNDNSVGGSANFLNIFIPKLIGLLFVFGALAFFFMLLWGAITWILSGGDKAHVENARGRITNALIGFVLMIATFAIVKLIEAFFGIDILSIDIGPLVIQ